MDQQVTVGGRTRAPVIWLQRKILRFSRYWLAWANLIWGLIVGLPWLAPVLMRIGAIGPGPGFLYWQRRLAPRWYHPVLDWLLRWPDPLLRLGDAAEALVGWRLTRG